MRKVLCARLGEDEELREKSSATLVVKVWPYVKNDAAGKASVATAFDYQGAKSTLLCSTTFLSNAR